MPERSIQTGIGAVGVKAPRVRDRAGEIRFSSSILPAYLRRTRSIEELLRCLFGHLKSGYRLFIRRGLREKTVYRIAEASCRRSWDQPGRTHFFSATSLLYRTAATPVSIFSRILVQLYSGRRSAFLWILPAPFRRASPIHFWLGTLRLAVRRSRKCFRFPSLELSSRPSPCCSQLHRREQHFPER